MNFLTKDEALALHEAVLEIHGGEPGFLNESMLDSALAAPVNRHGYESASVAECAATYAYHLTKTHAFIDGTKRIRLAATIAFLRLNDARVDADDDARHDLILGTAAGRLTRDEVDAWFAARVRESAPG